MLDCVGVACPPSGTVFHVMLGDIRKHVFLRQ